MPSLSLLKPPGGKPWLVGHRGAMAYAPENTLPSFELALAQGADVLECDVHLSRDGQPVVIHDATLDRTTNGSGRVRDLTLAELQRLDAGAHRGEEFRGTRLLSLDELLDWARTRAPLAIELKQPAEPYPDYEATVIRTLRRHRLERQVVIISFDHPLLARVKQIDPGIATGVVYGDEPLADPVARCREVGGDALHPRADLVTEELVAAAHAAGIAVSPWVVDADFLAHMLILARGEAHPLRPAELDAEVAALQRGCLLAGVDSAAANAPDRLRALIDELFA